MRVALVIPALDEAEALPGVLARIPNGIRVVVADNGSSDGTGDVARAAGVEVVREERRGYGSACLAAIRLLAADPPDILAIVDADGADDPAGLDRLVGPIAAGEADLVQADRTTTALPGALAPHQIWGNRLATRLIRVVTGHRYRDMGPFRAIRWSALVRLGMSDLTWGWNVEMQVKAIRAGLRVREIALPYGVRTAGRSKISGSVRGSARAGAKITWAVARYAVAPLP